MLLVLIAPPLIWAGTPDWLLRPLISRLRLTRIVGWITFPVVTFTIFNINFWIWHHPALYQLALESLSVHILMHLLFLATGLLNWWPTLSPLPELRPQSYLPRMLYLFAQMWPDTGLSLLLIFTPKVLYPAYALAPRLWGLTPLDDQQLGGILMWVPGGIVYVTVISVLFFRWFGENESAEREAIYRAAR
jgi:putative membrane protein